MKLKFAKTMQRQKNQEIDIRCVERFNLFQLMHFQFSNSRIFSKKKNVVQQISDIESKAYEN